MPDLLNSGEPLFYRILRFLSKLLVFSTLFLIFVGSLVTSHQSGLSVPDWPTSYGYPMFLFPTADMRGGIFYEHGHRLLASLIGFFTLVITALVSFYEKRQWVKRVSLVALIAVAAQGILGAMTVKFYLPTAVSVSHAMLAQSFYLITIFMAYAFSRERQSRFQISAHKHVLFWPAAFFCLSIYVQLFLGALMRHTESGLAIPDFPLMGNQWFPLFNEAMLSWIRDWHFQNSPLTRGGLITLEQVIFHALHRLGAVFVLVTATVLFYKTWRFKESTPQIRLHHSILLLFVLVQIVLGIVAVLTQKQPTLTSLHVVTGAALLGFAFLNLLRLAPLSFTRPQNKE